MINFTELESSLKYYSKILLPSLLPSGKFEGNEYVALNPTRNDRNLGSFRINTDNLVWCDFATDDTGKGFISLYRYLNNVTSVVAADELAKLANITNISNYNVINHSYKKDVIDKQNIQNLILRLWEESYCVLGTPVEKYLISRGLIGNIPESIRYLPNCLHRPTNTRWCCMLACITLQNSIIGLHRTYIDKDGTDKAPIEPQKMILGKASGGSVVLSELKNNHLIITEGIETGLSVRLAINNAGIFGQDYQQLT